MTEVDVVVVGAGPNGLAAAVTLARAGLSVEVFERGAVGGGASSAALTLPGFLHDLGSAVHPMAAASPFFQRFALMERTPFVTPDLSYAQAIAPGRSALAWRDLDRTAEGLGADGAAWRRLFRPLVDRATAVADLATDQRPRLPIDMMATAAFGLRLLEQGTALWNLRWRQDAAPALLSGVQAHVVQPLPSLGSAAPGLALAVFAHAAGWPIPVGGSQAVSDALVEDLVAHGGRVHTGVDVRDLRELPTSRAVVLDTGVPALLALAGGRLPHRLQAALRRFRTGDGVAKVDFALDGPTPWADDRLASAGTVHVGGTRAELALAERDVADGRLPEHPYVVASQPTTFDPSRAPAGQHVLWAYTHVPAGSAQDPTEAVTRRIERFAPGFRDRVLAVHAASAQDVERWNPNFAGGDIGTGSAHLRQLLARPVLSSEPWHLAQGLYLCSAAAAPGPGVHGMGGYHAARSVLRHEFGVRASPDLSHREREKAPIGGSA